MPTAKSREPRSLAGWQLWLCVAGVAIGLLVAAPAVVPWLLARDVRDALARRRYLSLRARGERTSARVRCERAGVLELADGRSLPIAQIARVDWWRHICVSRGGGEYDRDAYAVRFETAGGDTLVMLTDADGEAAEMIRRAGFEPGTARYGGRSPLAVENSTVVYIALSLGAWALAVTLLVRGH